MKQKSQTKLTCVVLAAGLGTRMKSTLPKVLHPIMDRPMLLYCMDALTKLKPYKIITVVGKEHGLIKETLNGLPKIQYAVQASQKGTAHALMSAAHLAEGTVLVVNGDAPLINDYSLRKFLTLHRKGAFDISVVSFNASDPASYGRILRDPAGKPVRIIEEKDATVDEKSIKEVNSGIYAIEPNAMGLLKRIKINRAKGEFYLTDILELAGKRGFKVGVHLIGEENEFLGINTMEQLEQASRTLMLRTNKVHQKNGVNIIDSSTVRICPGVSIGPGSVIHPNVYIEGKSSIGANCKILPNVHIDSSIIKDNCIIKDSSVIEGSTIQDYAQIGPFAHIRPGSVIEDSARVGNFVEIKKSSIGKGTKAMHLSYLGDAVVGKGANIGAGTITCNYDGKNKHKTTIGDGVFIGSDTQLIAPVRIGKGAYVGAGSTITKEVEPDALAVSRVEQRNIKGWAKRKRSI